MRFRRVGILAWAALTLIPTLRAEEWKTPAQQRADLASGFSVYDFEPRGDRPDSRDRDHDRLPDYWEPLRGPEYSAYESEKIHITEDSLRRGFFPDAPGHVLTIPFSGIPIGMQTLYSKAVDPQMAYEITAFVRTQDLDHSLVSIDVVWLRRDENGQEQAVGEFDRLLVPPGQRDWSEAPLRRRINELPPQANSVRLVLRIVDDPNHPGADRHGRAWFDDIRVESRPKIGISSDFRDDEADLAVAITYQGLTANNRADSPGNDGSSSQPKVYSRRVELRDVHGNLIHWAGQTTHTRRLNPGRSTTMTEEIRPRELTRRGVYYMQVRLYGRNSQPLAVVTQTIGRWAPPVGRGQGEPHVQDQLALHFDPLALGGKAKYSEVMNVLRHAGVFRSKLELWPLRHEHQNGQEIFLGLPRMLRALRSGGMRFTGTFGRLPTSLVPEEGMLAAMTKRQERLWQAMSEPILKYGTHIDDWQWGDDRDTSFGGELRPEQIATLRRQLQEMTSAFTQALPIQLYGTKAPPPRGACEAVSIRVPADMDERVMVQNLLPLAPEKFARLLDWKREVYPTEPLVAKAHRAVVTLGKRPVSSEDEQNERPLWLTLEPMAVDPHLRQQRPEREQAIDLARKIILGRVLNMNRIYAGSLLNPKRGLAAIRRNGTIIPRPALLALQTLSRHVSGTEYLGSFQLGRDIENYVFRKPGPNGTQTALVALWYNGPARSMEVRMGQGMGNLKKIDMAGNVDRMTTGSLRINQMPILIDGMSVPLARTRLSIRILRNPPLLSRTERQTQELRIRNFFAEPLTGTIRLVYAVDDTFSLEPGWVSPRVMRLNLPPGGEDKRVEIRRSFDVRPTIEAVQGRKFVLLETQLAAARESRFEIQRPTWLTSDLKLDPAPRLLPTPNPNERVVRLSLRWEPDPKQLHAPRLDMRPYYQVLGDQPTFLSQMTIYPGTAAAIRDIAVPFLGEDGRAWIGAQEDGGSRFIRVEVTDLVKKRIQTTTP